jgi:hypothetical protein
MHLGELKDSVNLTARYIESDLSHASIEFFNLGERNHLTTYKAARYIYIYICCHFTDTTTSTLTRDTQKSVCYF